MRPPIRTALALFFLTLAALSAATAQTNPLEPPSTGGLLAADRELAKLLVHARLLVIGAHPDDEDTSLLALVSRGMGGEAAYLSLSRGEGGQNLIGPELGVDLGLIRTEELLAARRLDGARQFFTRAYDFGYTRSLEETLRRWPKEALMEDTVRVLRRFRPQVVVSVFPNDGRGGHGQHQAAGLVAHEAYAAAADAAAWSGLAQEGALPWAPQALYRSTWFDRDATTMVLPTGVLDPLTGKSIYQLAMASRSQHRSQDMGRLQEPGPQQARVGWVAGGEGNSGAVLFAGIDTRLRALALLLPEGAAREATWGDLEAVESLAAQARALLLPTDLGGAAEPLGAAVGKLRQAHERAAKLGERGLAAAELLDEKLVAAERALAVVAGLVVDAAAERGAVLPGEPFPVIVTVWNSGKTPVAVAGVELESSAGWRQRPGDVVAQELLPGALGTWKLEAESPPGSPPTVPYFLEKPLQGDLYDWSTAAPSVRGLPFQPPPLRARVRVGLGALPLVLEREVVYRFGDQALGEQRRPLRAVPALEVSVEPDLLVWPLPQPGAVPTSAGTVRERMLEVALTSRSQRPAAGKLELKLPAGWSAPAPAAFSLPAAPAVGVAREVIRVPLRLPPTAAAGSHSVEVVARLASGETSTLAVPVIEYPHIRPVPRPEPARVELIAAGIRVPPLRRVGYVVGASDRVPGYLLEIGIPLEILGDRELAEGNFSGYDAIVVGSRAYETVPALARANARLLDYVRAGGLLLVQYQQYPFVDGGFPPLPLEIARPHDRITDETAPVTLLEPAHTAFTTPNALGSADWSGWIQERGLYFARTWDPGYTPLLELTDPGQPAQRGGLLVAKLGKGTYVYTGLAFFRQLPAGVPGAYRLFANLLGLGGRGS